MANPLLGVLFHWIGGFSSASFYVPYKRVRGWSWEVFWLTGGLVSWLLAPWFFAVVQTHDLIAVLRATPARTLGLCWLFGALWGFGGLTYGLTVRYLGISLGTAIALGLTAAFGTLIPPFVSGQFGTLLSTRSGVTVLAGVGVALAGIVLVGIAGQAKEHEQAAQRRAAEPGRVDFRRGLAVAVFSGVMSSCFAYGLAAGQPIRDATVAHGTSPLWQGLPVLCVVLLGGLTTNLGWCAVLIARNHSVGQFLGASTPEVGNVADGVRVPLLRNYLLCALGGAMWYFQFFFYTMGESQMGRFGFSSWTLHMASIILFATLWGLGLNEWKGARPRTQALLALGLAVLVASTAVIGLGNAIATVPR